MKNAKLAVAVGAGYLLGRMHKARWALALAGLAAGKRLSSSGGELLEGLMDSSPQLRELAGTVRGDLADAGRKAVMSAAGRKVDALTERLESGTSALRGDSDEGSRSERDEAEEPDEDEQEERDEDKRARAPARRPRGESKSKSAGDRRASARTTAKARGGAATKRAASPARKAGTARKTSAARKQAR